MRHKVIFVFICVIAFSSAATLAQENTVSVSRDDVIREIRSATAMFKDQKMAELYGYRKFGPDMPNMGTHWLYLTSAVDRNFDLSRPSTLTYLTINGEPVLTGVAYTYPVQPGETPPELPLKEMKWHYHSGNLEEEAFGLHPKSIDSKKENIPNLAMLHAWVWTDNPDGMFSADNWALSFVRNEIAPPSQPTVEASKALFMLNGGVDYYLKFIELAVGEAQYNKENVKSIMKGYSEKIREKANALRSYETVNMDDQGALKDLWIEMWNAVRGEMTTQTWAGIEVHLQSDNGMHHQ